MAWKCEKFIFDVLPFAKKAAAVIYPRTLCFAPLKNATGPDSLQTVQSALQAYDAQTFAAITANAQSPTHIFELDPAFYYPTPQLLAKWQGKALPPTPYVQP